VELPRLQPLYEQYKDKGFDIIAIEARRDTDNAKKLIADHKLTYTFLENGENDKEVVRKLFSVRVFPTSFVIGKDNKVYYYHLGFEDGQEKVLEEEIKVLLAKS
jgi:peroxiredoxin